MPEIKIKKVDPKFIFLKVKSLFYKVFANVNFNCNGYNFYMKIKFIIVFLFVMSSSFVFSAKYGKTDPDKLYTRALNFIDQERFFEAKKVLKAYTKSKPEDSFGWTLYAFSERKLGGLEKAKGLYEKALSLDADNKAALEYQGELFVELEMPALALANLEKLNTLCPNSCEEAEQLKSFIAGTAVK